MTVFESPEPQKSFERPRIKTPPPTVPPPLGKEFRPWWRLFFFVHRRVCGSGWGPQGVLDHIDKTWDEFELAPGRTEWIAELQSFGDECPISIKRVEVVPGGPLVPFYQMRDGRMLEMVGRHDIPGHPFRENRTPSEEVLT